MPASEAALGAGEAAAAVTAAAAAAAAAAAVTEEEDEREVGVEDLEEETEDALERDVLDNVTYK
ncbi:MAG: hypothetical protein ACK4YT_14140, partial [Sphingomonas sp.]